MEIVFLAAGVGRRMGSETEGVPKVLFPLRDRTILETNLDRLAELNSPPGVILVTGYRGELVDRVAKRYTARLRIRVLRNPDYATRGPAVSAQVGLRSIDEGQGIAIANGDTVFSDAILRQACSTAARVPMLFASRTTSPDADDVRIRTDPQGSDAMEAAKAIPEEQAAGISAGLLVASDAESEAVVRSAFAELVAREAAEAKQLHWHNVIGICAEAGRPAHLAWVPRHEWQEFDAPGDIQRYNDARDSVSADQRGGTDEPLELFSRARRRMS